VTDDNAITAPLVVKRSLSAQVYEILETRVINGTLRPGARLAEEAIAEEFGVSRSPVREAISELERVGLAERLGARDRRVVIPTAKFIADIYDTWCIVEIGRTYLSCLAAPGSDHRRIRELVDGMEEAVRDRQRERHLALSTEFHHLLTRRCRNVHLLNVLRGCERHIQWLETIYYRDIDVSETSIGEHREIAGHYIEKDLLGLISTIQHHISRQRNLVLAAMIGPQAARPGRRVGSGRTP
jgi:DNA-binding GntR family transcriptional regulator